MARKETTGTIIRALRLKKGITQAALADAVGIRPTTLWRHELGVYTGPPRGVTLIRIAEVLGVPPKKLLPGHETKVAERRARVKRG